MFATVGAGLFFASTIPQETLAQQSATYPAFSGTYRSSAPHPRVFATQADLEGMVARINTPGSFSAQNFIKLSDKVKAHLATDPLRALAGLTGTLFSSSD
jgi:hypothetical protein